MSTRSRAFLALASTLLLPLKAQGLAVNDDRPTGYPPIITITKPADGSTRHSQTTEIRLDYTSGVSLKLRWHGCAVSGFGKSR